MGIWSWDPNGTYHLSFNHVALVAQKRIPEPTTWGSFYIPNKGVPNNKPKRGWFTFCTPARGEFIRDLVAYDTAPLIPIPNHTVTNRPSYEIWRNAKMGTAQDCWRSPMVTAARGSGVHQLGRPGHVVAPVNVKWDHHVM